jgi:hypothetical protein
MYACVMNATYVFMLCMYVCMYACMYVRMYVCIYEAMHVCVCMYVRV